MFKKMLIVLMLVLLLLFVMISTAPSLDGQKASSTTESLCSNNPSATNSEVTQPNVLEPKTNVANNQPSNAEPGSGLTTKQPAAASDPSPPGLGETSQSGDPAITTPLPDGRIYFGPDPPYAYLPTCEQKGTSKMPIAPPEPEG